MATILTKVTFQRTSGVPEDVVVNTFVFHNAAAYSAAQKADIDDALSKFYNANNPGAGLNRVCDYISPVVSRAVAGTVRAYDITAHLDGSPAGSPVDEWTMGLLNPVVAGGPLPSETALVLTFHAHLVGLAEEEPAGAPGPAGNLRPKARKRGRCYVGPLHTGALEAAAVNGDVRPVEDLRNTLADAGNMLVDHAAGLMVWSRAAGAIAEVTGGWVDNAFDTQRRRGSDRTNRLTFGTGLG